MTKQEELKIVKQLTGVEEKQIRLNEIGWTSRVYLVDDGRIVFKFPRNKKYQENFDYEIKVLKLIKEQNFNVKVPIINWYGEHNEYFGFFGVLGTPLTPETLNLLDDTQKEMLGRQIGTFLLQFHGIAGFKNPLGTELDQINEYQKKYNENKHIFEAYFNDEGLNFIEKLFFTTAPNRIQELGKDPVFCHGDFGYNNILLDNDFSVGIVDFGDAGLNDRSIDFVDLDDEIVSNAALKVYSGDKTLREKILIRQKTFPIFLMLFYIDRKEPEETKKCVDRIRRIKEDSEKKKKVEN
jgi:Ser/Thr protein kinase RdoA (MazF antagonist)